MDIPSKGRTQKEEGYADAAPFQEYKDTNDGTLLMTCDLFDSGYPCGASGNCPTQQHLVGIIQQELPPAQFKANSLGHTANQHEIHGKPDQHGSGEQREADRPDLRTESNLPSREISDQSYCGVPKSADVPQLDDGCVESPASSLAQEIDLAGLDVRHSYGCSKQMPDGRFITKKKKLFVQAEA